MKIRVEVISDTGTTVVVRSFKDTSLKAAMGFISYWLSFRPMGMDEEEKIA